MVESINASLKARAEKVIPNGMYGHMSVKYQSPRTPQFFREARGAYVWDYDGNRYIDYLCAYGPNLLGYGHEKVDAAYIAQMKEVDLGPGPSSRMIELAEAYTRQFSHADWAMFCKNGTDATSMALMISRAYKDKPKVLLAAGAYHGATTWCTPMPAGTLPEERAHFIYYEYNNVESLKAAVEEAGDQLAAIFATPFKHEVIYKQELPTVEYATAARRLCDEKDALLVLDDVRAGFRLDRECSWHALGVEPDLVSWGKALANGHALSCLTGSDRAREAAGKVFVTGSFWFASASMAAALTTLEILNASDYLEETVRLGERLRTGLASISKAKSIDINQTGPVQMPLIMINDDKGERDLPACVSFCDALLDHGVFFHPIHNMFITSAMTNDDIDRTLEAVSRSVDVMRERALP